MQWVYIPYKGGSAAVTDVIAGNANVLFNGMLATYPAVKGGRLRGARGVQRAARSVRAGTAHGG